MKWRLWSFAFILFVCIYRPSAQTELPQDELEKMVQGSEIIVEGKLEKVEADLYRVGVSEIFQGLQRLKSLDLVLPPEQARLYLFGVDKKYQGSLSKLSDELKQEFYKNGHSLDAGEIAMKTLKPDKEWGIVNKIKLQSKSDVEYLNKEYIVVSGNRSLDVYMPLNKDLGYILFLKRQGEKFALAPFPKSIVKSSIFVPGRVREAAIQWRSERSEAVVAATVCETKEEAEKDEIQVTARCKVLRSYKGTVPEEFEIRYRRIRQAFPPMVILFDNLSYVFFLKMPGDASYYQLINFYEGAYPEDRYLLKDLENQAKNRFDQAAGKEVGGLRNYARMQKAEIKKDEPAIAEVMLLNVSQEPIEIYHNQVAYFTLFHILDETGKALAARSPRVISVPPVHSRYFVKLDPGGYIVIPSFNLQDYCKLPAGNYSIYVEFHLPWEYAGKTIGKTAWSGKTMSNKLELTVTE